MCRPFEYLYCAGIETATLSVENQSLSRSINRGVNVVNIRIRL